MNYSMKWDDIATNKADKGGATIIVGVKEYVSRANQQNKDK